MRASARARERERAGARAIAREIRNFIKEYIDNVDKEVFNKIQKHLENLKEINSIKPITIPVTEELKLQGVTDDVITIPLTFDPSTFFV